MRGKPSGGLEERLLGSGIEESDLWSPARRRRCDEVGGELVAPERGQVVAHDDALIECLVDGHGESAPQLGLSEQEQAEAVLGVHLVVGEKAQVLEDVGAQVVGLVDDEDRAAAGLGDETRDLVADLAEERGAERSTGRPISQEIVL